MNTKWERNGYWSGRRRRRGSGGGGRGIGKRGNQSLFIFLRLERLSRDKKQEKFKRKKNNQNTKCHRVIQRGYIHLSLLPLSLFPLSSFPFLSFLFPNPYFNPNEIDETSGGTEGRKSMGRVWGFFHAARSDECSRVVYDYEAVV